MRNADGSACWNAARTGGRVRAAHTARGDGPCGVHQLRQAYGGRQVGLSCCQRRRMVCDATLARIGQSVQCVLAQVKRAVNG